MRTSFYIVDLIVVVLFVACLQSVAYIEMKTGRNSHESEFKVILCQSYCTLCGGGWVLNGCMRVHTLIRMCYKRLLSEIRVSQIVEKTYYYKHGGLERISIDSTLLRFPDFNFEFRRISQWFPHKHTYIHASYTHAHDIK